MKILTDISPFLIADTTPLLDAMELLDKASYKVLFVTRDDALVGALTDGDIRRFILRNGDLTAEVSNVANQNPKYLTENDTHAAKAIMRKHQLALLPLVDERRHILSLFADKTKVTSFQNLPPIDVPVVIMAGGAGTRLYPYTKVLPKPLIPIGDVPIIERIIDFFYSQGCRRFYMIVNHKKNMIKAYFNEIERDYDLTFVDEDIPLGTGGGLSLLKGVLNETFILTNCDNIINVSFSDVLSRHQKAKNSITVLAAVQKIVIPYGVIHTKENGYIDHMEEKPVLPHLVNTGCYIVNPEVLDTLEDNTRIDFPTVITNQMEAEKLVGVYPIGSEDFLDMGQFDQMERMKHVLHISD